MHRKFTENPLIDEPRNPNGSALALADDNARLTLE